MDLLQSVFLYGVLAPLGVLGVFFVLVMVHELGHYAVGRYFGVGVDGFSIGFGPALFSIKDRHGTKWAFRALPLGGFVKFAGDANIASQPDSKNEMDQRLDALASKPIWQRALVVAGGPFANIILAFVLFTADAWLVSKTILEPVIGQVILDSPAQAAGLQPLDRITHVNDSPIETFLDLNLAFEAHIETRVSLTVERQGESLGTEMIVAKGSRDRPSVGASGLFAYAPIRITRIRSDSAAESMGLSEGDVISAYNQTIFSSLGDFVETVNSSAETGMNLTVERGGEVKVFSGRPTYQEITLNSGEIVGRNVFGFEFESALPTGRLGFLGAMGNAKKRMGQFAFLVFKLPGQFIAKQRSIDDLSGPVGISKEVGQVVVFTPFLLLGIAAFMSLQLGILNLLPIPILDGGHLLLYGAEGVLRRPLPPVLVGWLFRIGGALLLTFFVLVTFNDVRSIVSN